MKTIKFTFAALRSSYRCSEPEDQSGEYVRVETAQLLLEALKDAKNEIESLRDSLEDFAGSRGSSSFVKTLEGIIKEHS